MQYPINYYFKKDNLTLEYNKQLICFHSYNLKNKHQFVRFSQQIRQRKPQDINTVFKLARRSEVSSQMGSPTCKIIY